ncbi:dihydrofolate reductase family protein [Amycolatopsis magusensis]|uniref:dihydrofolate reductase family protein n=1 Tax=Amycolatopsis magusensis TaxID=882444 RepID=UPI0024A88AD2|nr:dihydrofolate reductase family protein [Amycolatopsis magusensis]MDI5978261.1 dihydrofolate reductase family protein [Amycolatopsis magusensis]
MSHPRKVVAQVNVSIDGYSAGSTDDGMGGMAFLQEHASHEQMSTYFEGVWRGADTAVVGRTNYEGFAGFWPPVAEDPDASPRDRDLATWLCTVEKLVFSRTLDKVEWQNSRLATQDPAAEIRDLKNTPGRDILVLNSASIIRQLLSAELIDELRISLLPATLGGGLRLFEGNPPYSTWHLGGVATLTTGAVILHYQRP